MYKIVRRFNGKLVSAHPHMPKECMVTYKPNEWSTAPIGGILIFESHLDVECFFAVVGGDDEWRNHDFEVWEVKAEEKVKPRLIAFSWGSHLFSHEEFLNAWEKENAWSGPKGTAAYRKVYLSKQIKVVLSEHMDNFKHEISQ